MRIAPAAFNFDTADASLSGIQLERIFDPAVVAIFFVANKSFTATGIPCREPRFIPSALDLSAFFACSIDSSLNTLMKAFSFGSILSMFFNTSSVNSREETEPSSI